MHSLKLLLLAALFAFSAGTTWAQNDVDDIPSQDLRVGDDENRRYFLIGPHADAAQPKEGFGLVLILPGGDGSADFHPFVKRIYKHSIPPGYLAAQLVAVKWTPTQQIVWPTSKVRVPRQQFTTEEYIRSVVQEIRKDKAIDPRRVFTLTWSSSGPAAYAASLAPDTPITGSFIAMSVFKPQELPNLSAAKGRAYYLYHSPQDRIVPIAMARNAQNQLGRNEARIKLTTYAGNHGWTSQSLFQDISEGIEWLEQNTGEAPQPKDPSFRGKP